MKNVFLALFTGALLTGCTADSLENYETYNVDKTKIQRPGSQGVYMEEVDKDKIRRPGSQGDD
ncbi:hypothetical protein BH23BAC2_BH23BAC2_17230 [soil metagenome]